MWSGDAVSRRCVVAAHLAQALQQLGDARVERGEGEEPLLAQAREDPACDDDVGHRERRPTVRLEPLLRSEQEQRAGLRYGSGARCVTFRTQTGHTCDAAGDPREVSQE
jgi:hypothetical protein